MSLTDNETLGTGHTVPAVSWDLLGAFLAVMQTGSLSGAARRMGVAQPTIRRHIETLEEKLGVVLFTRSPMGLLPTEPAIATLPYVEVDGQYCRGAHSGSVGNRHHRTWHRAHIV